MLMNGQRSARASARKTASIWTDCWWQILLPQCHHKGKEHSSRKPMKFFLKVALCWQGVPIKMASKCTLSTVRKKYQAGAVSAFLSSLPCMTRSFVRGCDGCVNCGPGLQWRQRAVPSAPHQPLINKGTTITRVQMLVARSRQLWNNFIDSAVAQGDTNAHARTKGEVSDSRGRRGGVNTEDLTGIYPPPTTPLTQLHTHTLSSGKEKKTDAN